MSDGRKRELWNAADAQLLRVEGDSAQYWDTPGGRIATLVFAKAKVTGERRSRGANGRVEL